MSPNDSVRTGKHSPRAPEALTRDQSRDYLDHALAGLSSDEKDLLIAYSTENHDVLAERLGISRAALRVRIHRLRGRLRVRPIGPRNEFGRLQSSADLDGSQKRPKPARQLRRKSKKRETALRILDVWAAILPTRIVTEDLGDYIEDINRRCAAGQRWCVYLRVCAALFWTALNAVGYAMKAVGKKSAG